MPRTAAEDPAGSPPPGLEEARRRLAAYLRENGLRATRQRDLVLRAFLRAGTHVSVDQLYDALRRHHPSIGTATIYRTMNLFVAAGIAKERRFHEGYVRYEPGIDGSHHDHLVCLECGRIEEFEEPTIERIQEDVARRRGFRIRYHRLELYGLCPACRELDAPPT